MMIFKRILSLVLTFIMCFSMIVFVNAEGDKVNKLTVSAVSGHVSEQVTVEVKIDNETGYGNLEFAVEFDKGKLEVVSAKGVGTVSKVAQANANGRVKVAFADVENAVEDGTVLTVVFNIKAEAPLGDIPLTLNVEEGVHYYYSGEDGMDMNFYEPVSVNGKVTVLGNDWPTDIDLNIADNSKYEYGKVPAVKFVGSVPAGAAQKFTYKEWNEAANAYVDFTGVPSAVGKYMVIAGFEELNGYNPFTAIERKYEITNIDTSNAALLLKGETVSAEGMEFVYDGEAREFELTNVKEWATPVYSYSTDGGETWTEGNSIKNAGTYTIKAVAEAANYDPVVITRTVVIKKFDVTVTASVAEKVYDGNAKTTVTGKINEKLPEGTHLLLGNPSEVEFIDANAGTNKAIKYTAGSFALLGTDKDNFNLVNAKPEAYGTIKRLEITVTPLAVQKLYTTEKDPEIKYTYAPDLIGSDKFEGALTREKADSNAIGTYNILPGTLELSTNYILIVVDGVKFTILDKEYTRIEIAEMPGKTEYVEGQNFVADGLKLRAYYKNAGGTECSKAEADLIKTGYTWTPETLNTVGDKVPVTVSYNDLEAVVEVKVVANALKDITINEKDLQKIFKVGSDFSAKGLKVTAFYTNFPEKAVALSSDKYTVSVAPAYDANKPGEYTVTVSHTFNGKTMSKTYVVEVVEKELVKIEVKAGKDSVVEYVANEKNTFKNNGFTVTAYYDNNTSETVTDYTFAPKGAETNRPLEIADQYITFKYTFGDKTREADYKITVLDNDAVGISVDATKTKKDYIEGNDFDPQNTIVVIEYRDGSTKTIKDKYAENGVTFAPAKVSLATKEITVKYSTFSTTIPVKVAEKKVTDIEITAAAETAIDGDTGASVIKTVKATYDNKDVDNDFKGYTVTTDTLKLTDPTKAEELAVTVQFRTTDAEGKDVYRLDFVKVMVLPREAKNETTGKNYQYFADAVAEASENDVVAVMNDVVITEDLRIEKSITIKLVDDNTLKTDENVTITTAKKVELKFDTKNAEAPLEITVNNKEIVVEAGVEDFLVKTSNIGSVARQINNAYNYIDKFYRDITVEKTVNGSIEGRLKVKVGEAAKFTITPDAGYVVEDVIVDGESVGAVTEYVFNNVRAPHTISAVFTEKAE